MKKSLDEKEPDKIVRPAILDSIPALVEFVSTQVFEIGMESDYYTQVISDELSAGMTVVIPSAVGEGGLSDTSAAFSFGPTGGGGGGGAPGGGGGMP